MAMSLRQSQTEDGDPVIAIIGELDIVNADDAREAMDVVLARNPKRVVFELSDLDFMDSSGISVLIHAANSVETVELRNPSQIVRRVLEATGLTDVLRMDPA
jgi:anti-anti-sigma factor